ncbi:MAG: hypothetical protein AAFW95_14510, partial [Cyanobacteria bacterium J06638_6]
MIHSAVAGLTTGLVILVAAVGQAADLSFATPDGLFRIEPSSSDRTPLIPTSSDRPVNTVAWSTDGQRLAVVQNYSEVYRFEPGSTQPELVFTSDCDRLPNIDLTWQRDSDTLVIKQHCPPSTPGFMGKVSLFLSNSTDT